MKLRQARNKDGKQIIGLIRKCYRDYPGCYLDVENDSQELNYVYTNFKKNSGKFWVYEKNKRIIVKKTGIGNKIYQFAQKNPASYGILSILFAVISGLAAATVFRRV